jgi:transcriptional regulator with GAF, ATPase, and Fis domain
MIWGAELVGVLAVSAADTHAPGTSAMFVLALAARLGGNAINNMMLMQELRSFNELLEERVTRRTAQLEKVNLDLALEIKERQEIEQTLKQNAPCWPSVCLNEPQNCLKPISSFLRQCGRKMNSWRI